MSLLGLGMRFKPVDVCVNKDMDDSKGIEKEHAKLLEEIRKYREFWGLEPLPPEPISPVVVSDEIWRDTSKLAFRNELENDDTRVGGRTGEILRTIYGDKFPALIAGVRVDPSAPCQQPLIGHKR